MVVSKVSWHYKIIAEFSHSAFLKELCEGKITTVKYRAELLKHCVMLSIASMALVLFGVALGTFVIADLLETRGAVVATAYAIGAALTTALVVGVINLFRDHSTQRTPSTVSRNSAEESVFFAEEGNVRIVD